MWKENKNWMKMSLRLKQVQAESAYACQSYMFLPRPRAHKVSQSVFSILGTLWTSQFRFISISESSLNSKYEIFLFFSEQKLLDHSRSMWAKQECCQRLTFFLKLQREQLHKWVTQGKKAVDGRMPPKASQIT